MIIPRPFMFVFVVSLSYNTPVIVLITVLDITMVIKLPCCDPLKNRPTVRETKTVLRLIILLSSWQNNCQAVGACATCCAGLYSNDCCARNSRAHTIVFEPKTRSQYYTTSLRYCFIARETFMSCKLVTIHVFNFNHNWPKHKWSRRLGTWSNRCDCCAYIVRYDVLFYRVLEWKWYRTANIINY